jgi:NAD(P)-dependent dehydrogenase (short-subunit alcohol dehydrogenase family)
MEIKGKTAIITGATGKLGGAIVVMLAKSGVQCICIYNKNSRQAKELGAVLNRLKTKNLFIQTDLTTQKNIEKVFAEIEKFTTPQILINAAAVFEKKLIEDVTFEYIRGTFDINFAAPVIMMRKFVEFVRQEIKNKGEPIAKIINITDIVAQNPPAGFSIYSASKSALAAATKSLAKELAPDFTVNAVSPGIINFQKGTSAKLKKRILSHIPAGRTGSPDEIAAAVKFLIENDYLTGQIINVDGGKTI